MQDNPPISRHSGPKLAVPPASFTPVLPTRAWHPRNVGAGVHTVGMADIEILEVRAFEARCFECGETGPIESSAFFAMVWEEGHACAAIRIDADATELAAAS